MFMIACIYIHMYLYMIMHMFLQLLDQATFKKSLLTYPFPGFLLLKGSLIRSPAAFLAGSSSHYLEAFGYIPDGLVFRSKNW